MKKLILLAIVGIICGNLLFFTKTFAIEGSSFGNQMVQPKAGQMQVQPLMGQPTTASGIPTQEQLKQKELELKKREQVINSPMTNSSEAVKNFESTVKQSRLELQQKVNDAKKQRTLCLQGKAQDLRSLEQDRKASMSALQSTCTPKTVQTTLEKPTKPTLDGLTTEDKKNAVQMYQQAMKDYNAQIKAALTACRAQVTQTQQDFKERMLTIKEQCSNTERTVLGLSTDVPYNIDPTVIQQ